MSRVFKKLCSIYSREYKAGSRLSDARSKMHFLFKLFSLVSNLRFKSFGLSWICLAESERCSLKTTSTKVGGLDLMQSAILGRVGYLGVFQWPNQKLGFFFFFTELYFALIILLADCQDCAGYTKKTFSRIVPDSFLTPRLPWKMDASH